MTTNVSRRSGIYEAHLAPQSGLRQRQGIMHLVTAQTQNVNARPIGGTASAAVSAWTALTVNNRPVPFCGTLVALLAQASTTTGTVQLRVRGFDQFGQYVEEVTPVVSYAAKTNNYIYLAKVFSYVTSVEFKSTGLDIAGDTLSLGQRWDWTRTNDATNQHHAGRNLGIPIYSRLAAKPAGSSLVGQRLKPAVAGGLGSVYMRATATSAIFGDYADSSVHQPYVYGHAGNVLAISALPSNGETVTIDSKVYTWKTVLTSADGDLLIGADTATCGRTLAAAVNLSGGAGSIYGANTTRHPTVRAGKLISAVIEFFAVEAGAMGNLIAATETMANGAWAAATFFSGYDLPLELIGLTVRETNGSVATLRANQLAIGHNEAGWEGSIEKAHILFQSDVSFWAAADNMFLTYSLLTAEAAA